MRAVHVYNWIYAGGPILEILKVNIWLTMPPTNHFQHNLAQHPTKLAPPEQDERQITPQRTKLCSTDCLKQVNLTIWPAKLPVARHRGGQRRPPRTRKQVSEPIKNGNGSVFFQDFSISFRRDNFIVFLYLSESILGSFRSPKVSVLLRTSFKNQ